MTFLYFLLKDPLAAVTRPSIAVPRRAASGQTRHPLDTTLIALAAWLEEVEGRGFVLVPLTAVVDLARPSG